jgi:hypothetical protein
MAMNKVAINSSSRENPPLGFEEPLMVIGY